MREEPNVVDFETKKIESRPAYPPKPVSMAIRWAGGKKEFFSWGHAGGNNCDIGTAVAAYREVSRQSANGTPVVFHNSSFDTDVADIHLGVRPPKNIEDTLFLAFLKNPREPTIALKPMSEKYLDMPPDEQEDLRDYILEHVRTETGKRVPKNQWGAYISEAPGDIAEPYVLGDIDRTYKLWRKFRPEITKRGMDASYARELSLLPITMEMERSGVRVDLNRLKKAAVIFADMDRLLVKAIHRRLGISSKAPSNSEAAFNIDSGPQLAKALIDAGKLSSRVLTPTGRQSTKITVLHETCNDKKLLDLLSVHSVLAKYNSTFVTPWIEQAEQTHGYILPKFAQVHARDGNGGGGTRTGRYSCSNPNLQTVTANVDESKNRDVLLLLQKWLREEYEFDFIGLRDFFLPDEGSVLIATDYNQQEVRLLGHFEEGLLTKAYNDDPKLDVHTFIQQLIKKITGVEYARKSIKILVFGMIYGMGVNKLALAIGEPVAVAKAIRDAMFEAIPGIRKLMRQLQELETRKLPLRTWGGREYYTEDPIIFNGSVINFGYKNLNTLIQGSAADVTKQGMINVHEQVPQARIAIQVHDELICMAPNESYGPKIARAMCDMKFAVPMTAEPKYSRETWARVKEEY